MEQHLKKYENQPVLPVKSIEIFKALESRLVKKMDDTELLDAIENSVLRSYFEVGFKEPDQADFNLMTKAILRNIRQEPKAIRENEIQIAFSRGILKEYGDFMGLSVASFTGFIKGYLEDSARILALNEKNRSIEVEVKEPSQNEKFEIAKGNALRAYVDITFNRDISLYAPIVYDFLDGIKLIEIGIKEKKDYFKIAREQLIKENTIKTAGKTDMIALIAIKKFIDKLQAGEEIELVKSRAKGLSLVGYLQTVIFEEVDFNELIENKRSEYGSK